MGARILKGDRISMTYKETIITIHIQARKPHQAIDRLFHHLIDVEHEFAERGEGYIKVEIFNNEIEEIERKAET